MLKNIATISANYKKIINYKMKRSTKYVRTVKSFPEVTTDGVIYHVKGCMVRFCG